MGFSPGEFETIEHSLYHWEAKDNYLVLWNELESNQILRLSYEQAKEAFQQLRTAIYTGTGEDPV